MAILGQLEETTFRHEALFYEDNDSFLGATVPFLQEALGSDGAALVAVTREKVELLREWMGEAAAAVEFVEMEAVGRNPARIIPLWREFLAANEKTPGELRGIGEPIWSGRSAAELDECRRHESLLDLAFEGGRGWALLCPYDVRVLDKAVLKGAHASHPCAGDAETGVPWAGAGASPFEGALPAAPVEPLRFGFGRDDLATARRLVEYEAGEAGLSRMRTTDLVTAASELTANSVLHGGGGGELRAWRQEGEMIVEVRDRGQIEDPLAGRVKPSPEQRRGRGLWLANQLCDLVRIRSGAGGTTVRLHLDVS